MGDLGLVVKGVLAFFVGILVTVVSWYIVPVFISYLQTDLLKGLFWAGLATIWVLSIIVIPANYIIKGMAR